MGGGRRGGLVGAFSERGTVDAWRRSAGGREKAFTTKDMKEHKEEIAGGGGDRLGRREVRLAWEEGHAYGIFDWHYLWKLCPCEACRDAHTTW